MRQLDSELRNDALLQRRSERDKHDVRLGQLKLPFDRLDFSFPFEETEGWTVHTGNLECGVAFGQALRRALSSTWVAAQEEDLASRICGVLADAVQE
jgi:hypothetical protein